MIDEVLVAIRGLGLPLFIGATWIFICLLLARLGGWSRLAEAYGALGVDVRGTRYRFRSGAFGFVSYNGPLMLEAGPQGLSFGILFPFRIGHPRFSVPWADLQFAPRKRWLVSTVELTFARCPGVTVTLPRGLAEKLATEGGLSIPDLFAA